jgi:hypothetical protein
MRGRATGIGLGCLAGAVVYLAPHRAAAQRTAEDSARARQDSITLADTARGRVPKADSILLSYHPDTTKIKAPLAHAEQPPLLAVGPSYHWNRDELFASGALTLADLLDRVPGFTGFRAGWISTPMIGAYMGNAARIRIYYDGIELDPLNARTRNVTDLATIEIWTLEEVGLERGADELRVYLRTWRVDHTTPYSRADVSTGTPETNMYRAFFGERFHQGLALQVAAQQFTNVGPFGGGGDQTSLLARIGWASGPWSVDVFGDRYRRGMDPLTRLGLNGAAPPGPNLGDFGGTWTNAYVRAGYGDPDHGVWAQLIASTEDFKNSSLEGTARIDSLTGLPVSNGSADTTTSESQYIAAGGFSRWGIRFSGTERVRVVAGHGTSSEPSARASFESGPLAVSAFIDQRALTAWPTLDSANRVHTIPVSTEEISARLTPLPFFSVAGVASRSSSPDAPDAPPTSIALRGEAGLRLGRLWLGGGVMTQDTARVAALSVYDSTYAPAAVGRTTGRFGSIRGVLWRAFNADITAIDWGSAGPYRPHYEARAEVALKTEWLSRFPRHTFAILASGTFDYRTPTLFPTELSGFQQSPSSYVFSTLLEIRILHATLTWQFRNTFGYIYNLVPGFIMPRQTNLYGVRWSFWN